METLPNFQDIPDLEYLNELSRGPFGVVWLARVLRGDEAGRLIAARRLSTAQLDAADVERIVAAARGYASLTQPYLAKILGAHKCGDDLVLLEEHVAGVPLRTLQQLALARQTPIPVSIAIRIMLDVLQAAAAVRKDCSTLDRRAPNRIIFPDTVIVATFGDSLLSAVGVAEEICRCQRIREHVDMIEILDPLERVGKPCTDERYDVYSAGAILWQLLVVRGLFGDLSNQQSLSKILHAHKLSAEQVQRMNLCVPPPVAAIIRHATVRSPALRYRSLGEMIQALEELPASVIGKDHHVRAWLENAASDFLLNSQWSAGLGTRLTNSQPPSSAHAQRPSFSDNFLPWEHPTLAAGGATLRPARSVIHTESQSKVASGLESYPATAASSNSTLIHGPQRSNRRAYVVGALLGIGLALVLSYVGPRLRSSTMAAAGMAAPSAAASSSSNFAVSDQSQSISRRNPQDRLAVDASSTDSKVAVHTRSGANIGPAPKSDNDQAATDPTNLEHARIGNANARAKAAARPRATVHVADDPWGI